MRSPRVSVPITLTVALVALSVAVYAVGQVVVAREIAILAGGLSTFQWVLVIVGTLFFGLIIAWTILQAVWLVREIRTNQRQQNFIDAVTHELHTPLASLKLYLDTLRGQDLGPERREEFFGIMSEDLERLQRTIDQILSAARSEGRRSHRAYVDLVALLGDCIDDARARHGFEDDAIDLRVPRGARVRGDPEQLRLVFRNLLENAVRYSHEKLRVAIAVRAASARRLEIEFADEGVGIAPFELSAIFARFKQSSLKDRGGGRPLPSRGFSSRGLGLGLYIVRNIVRAHGGQVRAESEGAGTGSRFIVTLPGTLDGDAHPAR